MPAAAMAMAEVMPLTFGVRGRGVVAEPVPACPSELKPHAQTSPLSASASEWNSPAEMATMLGATATGTNTGCELPVVLFPSCPLPL